MTRDYAGHSARRAGFTILEILVIVIIIGVIIALIAGTCIGVLSRLDTSITAESITLAPSKSTVNYGSSGTFTVAVSFREVYDRTRATSFKVFIYEDDFIGDALLDSTVVVIVPQNEKTGSIDFALECDGIGRLKGVSGSRYQGFADYDVYAVLQPIANGVLEAESANVEVECREEE